MQVRNSALNSLDESIQDLVSFVLLTRDFNDDFLVDFDRKNIEIQENIKKCLEEGNTKEQIKESTKAMDKIIDTDFAHRAREWPRGYEGDFITINYLFHRINKYKSGSLPWFVENYLYSLPIVGQHRNKINFQYDLIKESIQRNNKSKIAILACGGGIDLHLAQDIVGNSEAVVYVNDQDEEAIEYLLKTCDRIRDKIIPVKCDILVATKKLSKIKEFDLVLAGGVFDYIDERKCNFIVRNVYNKMLKKEGIFGFTNIASPNPYRYIMEYIMNWTLIERSEDEIKKICTFDGSDGSLVRIRRDLTGLTHLVELVHG